MVLPSIRPRWIRKKVRWGWLPVWHGPRPGESYTLIGGKGDLIVTGQLGDVMQESARAAVSCARANLDRFGIKESIFENVDIHIHVPAGAIPKDGPSAGIAMATALISVLTNTPVRNDIAMTQPM